MGSIATLPGTSHYSKRKLDYKLQMHTGIISGDMSYCLTKQTELFDHNDHHCIERIKGKAHKPESTNLTITRLLCHVVGYFAAAEPGALHKIDGMMLKEHYAEVLT